MKKSAKTIGIVLGAIVVIVIIFGAVFFMRMRAEIGKMAAMESGDIRDGIIAVKDEFVNIYLVKGRDGYILFDAGNKRENVEMELKKLKIDGGEIKAVFLTHSDGDHIRALGLFGKARVFISDEEEQMVNGKTARFFFIMKNALPVRHEKLRDGQTIEIAGITIKGILTPGHTPGSMCYLVNNRHLFTGDCLSLKAGKAGLFNDLFNMDSELQKKSLGKLKRLPEVKFVYTAHYGSAENQGQMFDGW